MRYFDRKYTKYKNNKKITKLYYRNRKNFNKKTFSKKRAYNVEISEDFDFDIKLNLLLNLKEEENKETAVISRKVINKIFFFD